MSVKRIPSPLLLALPLLPILTISITSQYPDFIEKHYAQQFYPAFSHTLRTVSGVLPFSLGDLLYLLAGAYLLIQAVLQINNLRNRQIEKNRKWQPLARLWLLLSGMYILFYVFWGLNYYRLGVTHQMQLKKQPYSKEELMDLCRDLVQQMNQHRTAPSFNNAVYVESSSMLQDAELAYANLSKQSSFLQPTNFSLKSSWYNTLGNYAGFSGYYNPFTGEGQINTQCPKFLQPFITCHELAHQLGYASESEANFVGFLATSHSQNITMKYSGEIEMYVYATGRLQRIDSNAVKSFNQQLHPLIKKDLSGYRNYLLQYETVFLEWTNNFYDFFLRSNNQTSGIGSYRDVVGWVIAYRKKVIGSGL